MYYYLYLIAENKKTKSPILDLSYRPQVLDDTTNPDFPVSLYAHYLTEWPKALSELTHLEELNLSGHHDIAFPDNFAALFPHLRRLILHGAILEKLPDIQGLDIDWNLYQQHKNELKPEQIVGVYYCNSDFESTCSEGDKLPCNDFIEELTALKLPKLQFLKIEATLIHSETVALSDKIAELTELKGLSLINNKLFILPEVLGKLKKLEQLTVNANYLSELPTFVFEFSNLKHLDLQGNYIANLGDELPKLQKLEYLDIGENYISKLPESLAKLPNLRALRLSKLGVQAQKVEKARAFKTMNLAGDEPTTFNLMTQISGENAFAREPEDRNKSESIAALMPVLTQIKNLELLDISHNEIYFLAENFGDLNKLKRLYLQHNALNQLPDSFEKLSEIRFLQLSANSFTHFPSQIFKLKNIESLFLNCALMMAEPWRDSLPIADVDDEEVVEPEKTELEKEFEQYGVDKIPNRFAELPLLKILTLRDNYLANAFFLDSVFNLKNLHLLDLTKNGLGKMPASFSGESTLEVLLLSDASLTKIPDGIGNLQKLNYVDFSVNKLTEIPETIGNLSSLESIIFYNNEILEIPESFCLLYALKQADFSSNKITSLPKNIHLLKQLQMLSFSDNHLSKIPFELSLLPNLKALDISSCGLRKIPKEILLKEGLDCNMGNNGLISPPLEIAQNGIEAIKAYFDDLEKQKNDYLNEAKLMIVGSPGAGKTTLRVKLFDVNNPMPTAEDSTEGIDIEQLLFKLPDNGQFRMNIWDFGGQELYHSTHQFFYTRRSLYVLVLNTRRDDDRIDYWLHNIRFFGGDSPVIIVQNQEKDRSYALNEQRYRSQFPNIKAFVALNLSNSAALPALLDLIKKTIVEIPHTGDELPANWMEIRQLLAEKAKNEAYISYSEFENICKTRDLDSAEKIATLCHYLHELGTLLHFAENRILKNIVFLRNTWVLDAVYKVLDNDLVKNKQGARFKISDLDEIWLHPDYKKVKDELLELMLKFEICYLLPDGQSFLVPQLLPPNPPLFEFPSENALSLRYVYDFMPRGLLTRFIVQMNHYIADSGLVWKEGVILKRLDALAKVTEDYDNKTLFIKIAGANARELSAIIFDELDRIHNSFPQLPQVQKLIPCNCSVCTTAGNEPFLYDHKKLLGYIENKRDMVVCDKSYKDVPVRPLLDGLHNPLLAQVGDGVEILFVAANPRDTQPLDLDKEVEMLREVVENGRHQDHIRVEQRWEVSYDKLQQTVLKVHPEIVHFSGHGISQGLILEKADGLSTVADAALLEGLFAPLKNEVFCIIFNACYSEAQAKVIAKHIPFVVGMNTAVSDKAALLFTKGFYRGLSNRLDVEFAFSMGINMVQSEKPEQVNIFELWKNGEKV